ncbi:cytochrome c biogenesis CcdA family protein [Ferroacidibacillus organovorans]|uniref:Cytochrome C biogenesis protein n=1 Tax=Ferroacidibacillus organovorans TaxID=1765683 RepID=A0A161PWV6_9BACL|nr:cytochrome c biogenesis protein CcdA [Ferroacidibacillus organovorans]KYP80235.1 cytochrome C biogenesis protein [Ferroacidibacillus organovorans]OAG93639.1 cytochrome C biogenesis protein [Ferroacidibacillus organovorans]OPG17109.1 cytochrome C biogenesis protein [Ferroacidibacillus organovorans]
MVPSIWLAFIAGLVSFISPCCLPLYPSYISYISGVSYGAYQKGNIPSEIRKRALSHAVFFVLGFSVIFVALGASASLLGLLFAQYRSVLSQVGGVIVIVMGLFLMGVIKPGFLMRELKWHVDSKPQGFLGAFVIGMSFSAGWTPCIGPILASVITVAATNQLNGALLMLFYTVGFAIPFLILAYTLGSVRKLHTYSYRVNQIGGGIMVFMGILLATGQLTLIIKWLIGLYHGYIGM